MIAYNKKWLSHQVARQQIDQAAATGCISAEEYKNATALYSTGFYTPNYFIRIGLFILTNIIASFSLGFLSLLFLSGANENTPAVICILFGSITYGALEIMVRQKYHFQSGADDALLWMSASFLFSGINLLGNISPTANAWLIFIIACFCTLRFADMLMAAVTTVAFLAIVFFSLSQLGNIAKAMMPFILMLLSAAIYFTVKKNESNAQCQHYKNCLTIIEITSLLCFYIAGNYFVVREASISFFHLQLKETESIPFSWLFWLFSTCIPLLYIFAGIQKKDSLLIRTGLLLVAAIVFTVRYYHHLLPAELALIVGGMSLLLIAYSLMRFLNTPKKGFTAAASLTSSNNRLLENVEAIVIAETLSTATEQQQSDTTLGGGDFGGGGGSGDY